MTGFVPGEQAWIDRLGNLRNVVRQEVISRQLAPLVGPGSSVLDVGCGQGTQALRLASAGCRVTGVDPSPDLLARCADSARVGHLEVELLEGGIEGVADLCGGRTFDLVCCHGVLMYLDDWAPAVGHLAERVARGGHVSLTFRNGHALAMRPGLRGDWAGALAAFDATTYVNELGLPARAHRTPDIAAVLAGLDGRGQPLDRGISLIHRRRGAAQGKGVAASFEHRRHRHAGQGRVPAGHRETGRARS